MKCKDSKFYCNNNEKARNFALFNNNSGQIIAEVKKNY